MSLELVTEWPDDAQLDALLVTLRRHRVRRFRWYNIEIEFEQSRSRLKVAKLTRSADSG